MAARGRKIAPRSGSDKRVPSPVAGAVTTFPSMSGKISPATQQKLNELREFLARVQRVHGLVELLATARTNPEQYEMPVRRAFDQLKLQFMGAGYDSLSQLAGSMAIAAKRGGTGANRGRILREGVGSIRFQLELEARSLMAAEVAAQEQQRAAEEGA